MKFEIRATYGDYPNELIEKYPVLKRYGFEVIEECRDSFKLVAITDENGKPIKQKVACSYKFATAYIQINNLEDILNLKKDVDEDIIIYKESNTIEIYDGHRE